jgi:hypothetical protein
MKMTVSPKDTTLTSVEKALMEATIEAYYEARVASNMASDFDSKIALAKHLDTAANEARDFAVRMFPAITFDFLN